MSSSSLLRPGPLAFRRSDGELPRTSFDVKPPRRLPAVRRKLSAEAALLAGACLLLAALAGTMGVVSWHAQFAYVYAVKHEHLASVLEALGLDAGAVIFSVLGIALARLGRQAAIERALVLACALGSCTMNLLGADLGSPRSVVVYVMPPLLFACGSDRLVAVVRRSALGLREGDDSQRSAWLGAGRAALYGLRFMVAAPSTAAGVRRMLLDATPLPGSAPAAVEAAVIPPAIGASGSGTRRPRGRQGGTKTEHFLELVTERYGPLSELPADRVSPIAGEVAPEVDLHAGSARTALRAAVLTAQAGGAR
jgi:hypothetical protein